MKELIRFIDPAELLRKPASLTTEESDALNEINRRVTGAESLDVVMDFAFSRTKNIFPCDRIGIAFLEDRGRRVVARAARANYSNIVLNEGYSEGMAGSTLQEILQTGRIRVIDDLRAYLDIKPSSRSTAAIVEEGQRSSLTCPLIVEGRPVGFLFRNSKKPAAYSEHEVLIHVLMAERLSQAVEKAWRIAQLSRANEAYMEMLSFASHELRSPLATILMECRMLLDGFAGGLSGEQRASIGRMEKKVQSLVDTTTDYLSLARYEGGRLTLKIAETVDILEDVIKPVLEQLNEYAKDKQMRITIEPETGLNDISCDPGAFQTVFLNLIGNGIKYGEEGGEIRISLNTGGSSFSASVWNTGPGFPPEENNKLFKRFSRIYAPEFKSIRGTGVGLYIVWQLIDLHGGIVNARSEYGKWAEFQFSVPQPAPVPFPAT